jgi:transcriptional regulator with XRE-family HTH domain
MTKKMLNCEIGNRVKELRKSFGITREQLAERLGLTVSHMGLIERGERGLTVWNCKLLSKTLCVPMEYILLGGGEMPTSKNINALRENNNQFSAHELQLFDELIAAYFLISPAKRNADIIFESLRFALANYTKILHFVTA